MRVCKQFNLQPYNSYRLNATCETAYFPSNEAEIRAVFQENKERKILLGSGHNVILSKTYYPESFVIFADNLNKTTIDGTTIEVEAGATMVELCDLALQHELTGLETFYDIPSSAGGAVVMNAGAGGEEMKDLLISVKYYDPLSDSFHEIRKEDIGFEYRNSFFQKNPGLIVVSAKLQLQKGTREQIKEKMERIKTTRWQKQPRDLPNAGSVFKRPPGHFVGPLVDELGLKGFSIGDAQISGKHSGFIVNKGNATGKDIIDLITYVQQKVKEKFNLHLEVEQRIL